MRLEREDMPLKSYSALTVSQSIEDQVRMECYDQLLELKEDGSSPHHDIQLDMVYQQRCLLIKEHS